VPGSQTIAGHSTAHSGTRERHAVPKEASNESKRRRRKYGGMPVGPGNSRGVDGVMPIESLELGHSKDLAAKCRGMSRVCHTLRWITSRWQYCPPISTGSKGMLQYSWQGPSEWHGRCFYTVVRWVSFAEEPDVGKPQVRFREGQECYRYMEEILWHRRESRRQTENTNFFLSAGSLLPTRRLSPRANSTCLWHVRRWRKSE
jgi:hypothetical protein